MSGRDIDWSIVHPAIVHPAHPAIGYNAAFTAFRNAEEALDNYVRANETAPTDELATAFDAAQIALQAVCPHLMMRRVGRISKLQNRFRCEACMGELHVD